MSAVSELDGIQKAAILLITLGPEKAAGIFKHLKEDEIEQLTLEIANTRSVSPADKEAVLNEFYEVCLAQQYIAARESPVTPEPPPQRPKPCPPYRENIAKFCKLSSKRNTCPIEFFVV